MFSLFIHFKKIAQSNLGESFSLIFFSPLVHDESFQMEYRIFTFLQSKTVSLYLFFFPVQKIFY